MKNIDEFSGKKFRRKDQQAEKDKIERVTGLGRRTREEIAKWNQMTAVRFLTGGDIRHPRPHFGGSVATKQRLPRGYTRSSRRLEC